MLQTSTNPLYALIGVSAMLSTHSIIAGYLGYDISIEAESLGYIALTFMIAWWAYDDAGKQNYYRPFEFGAFMIFAWPLLLPIYLYQTRKLRGILLLLGMLILYWLPWALGWLAYFANPENI